MRLPRLALLALAIAATDVSAQAAAAPLAPDYGDPQAWLCRPDRPGACDVDLSTTVSVQRSPDSPASRDIQGDPAEPFGLHLVDMELAMGDLIDLVGQQTRSFLDGTRRR